MACWLVLRVACVRRLCPLGRPWLILAEGPWCGSPPLFAGVCWFWCRFFLRQAWLRALGAFGRHSLLASASIRWSLLIPGPGPWVRFPAIPCWGPLVLVVGGPSPILAEGPGCGSPRFLARVRWYWMVPRQSSLRVLVAVPRHSWLASASRGGGCCFQCSAVVRGSCVFLCCVR